MSLKTFDLGHGRLEQRSIKIAPLTNGKLDFPGSRSIAIIERSFENKKTGKCSSEQVAYISSLTEPSPADFLHVTRNHWAIENSLHWVKDVTFSEDRQTMRSKNGPFNMSALRGFAISVANLIGATSHPEAIRFFLKTTPNFLTFFNPGFRLSQI